ncbi:PTS mannose transporter subunit IIA [Pigmentiphaga sp.]|jgi:Phosphotransferase system, mannose/fructose-specific component IIA|uniref:PTS sugar transporter subunit IIA n=1 Tax=Pigmentiphaga sp. TaxID=1977564 RepID=UPI0025F3C45B|nr:PTS mannose transporter subunit IIA [Pigmentiphaga sp.]MBX6317980.1 PTS mannose transporter subunit IIA [Pigmentiphaga sp.]
MAGIVIVAHEPLASSLLSCASHIFGELSGVQVYDAGADEDPDHMYRAVLERIQALSGEGGVLVLTDVVGATPSNQTHRAAREAARLGTPTTVLAGVNIPMLLRTLPYRHLSLEDLAQRALSGGAQGVLRVEGDSEDH